MKDLETSRFILDTNIIIAINNADEQVLNFVEKNSNSEFFVSILTKVEASWYFGMPESEAENVSKILSEFNIAGIDNLICERSIKLRRELNLKSIDSLICATANLLNAKVVTRDVDIYRKFGKNKVTLLK